MTLPRLTVRGVHATGVQVPMNHVLGTSAQAVRQAPLLLVDVTTEEGITGRAWQFCYLPAAAPAAACLLDEVARVMRGERIEPAALWGKLARHFTLIGVQGIVRMAMAMFDVACWDALARAAGVPLASLLGGTVRPVPAYNSNGLGLMAPGALADEADELLAEGFRAVKLRLGYADAQQDLRAVRAVRGRVPDSVVIMTDYNQALGVEEAIRRGRMLDGEGVYWIEEPVAHDNHAGCAAVARAVATPVQLGENFSLPDDLERALALRASDYVMPDLERIGGVTGWLRAREITAAAGMPTSSHLYPEVSAHLLAVTPTAHWLEYVDWANAVLTEPLQVVDGNAVPSSRPGSGLEWDEDAVRRFRMS